VTALLDASTLVQGARRQVERAERAIATARAVLRALDNTPKTLADVVTQTGASRSSLQRHLAEFERIGLAVRHGDRWLAGWAADDWAAER
jgi:DNA-binding IclR family transcriptional regulator